MATAEKEDVLGRISEDTIDNVVGADIIRKHLNRVKARKSSSTLRNRRVALRQFADFCEREGLSFDEIAKEHVNEWIDEFLLDEYAPRSIRTKVYDLSSVYQYLEGRDVVNENPIEDVDLKDFSGTKIGEYTDVRYLEIDEYEAMVDACSKLRNQLLIEFLWETGCRASEAVSTRISDIDREERSINIETAKQGALSASKSRTVYYSRSFSRTLQKWLDRGGRSKYLGVSSDGDGYLLVTKEAPSMAVNRVNEIVHKLASEDYADIQQVLYTDASGTERNRVTAHAFRHSYAVHRVKNGMPLVYLQDLLGHEEIEVTRKYLQFRDDDVAEAERKYRP
jgi:integrase/recombinase XerD